MDLGAMASDLVNLLRTVFPSRANAPGLVLVGHSMVSGSPSDSALVPRVVC